MASIQTTYKCQELLHYHNTGTTNAYDKAMTLMHDMLSVIQSVMVGTATITSQTFLENSECLWKIQGPNEKPLVILHYGHERIISSVPGDCETSPVELKLASVSTEIATTSEKIQIFSPTNLLESSSSENNNDVGSLIAVSSENTYLVALTNIVESSTAKNNNDVGNINAATSAATNASAWPAKLVESSTAENNKDENIITATSESICLVSPTDFVESSTAENNHDQNIITATSESICLVSPAKLVESSTAENNNDENIITTTSESICLVSPTNFVASSNVDNTSDVGNIIEIDGNESSDKSVPNYEQDLTDDFHYDSSSQETVAASDVFSSDDESLADGQNSIIESTKSILANPPQTPGVSTEESYFNDCISPDDHNFTSFEHTPRIVQTQSISEVVDNSGLFCDFLNANLTVEEAVCAIHHGIEDSVEARHSTTFNEGSSISFQPSVSESSKDYVQPTATFTGNEANSISLQSCEPSASESAVNDAQSTDTFQDFRCVIKCEPVFNDEENECERMNINKIESDWIHFDKFATKECYVKLQQLDVSNLEGHISGVISKNKKSVNSHKQNVPATPVKHGVMTSLNASVPSTSLDQTGTLLTHKSHETQFKCSYCKTAFPSENVLKAHHCTPKVKKTYSCHYCDMQFDLLSLMKSHEKFHKQTSRFQSSHLKKKYSKTKNVKAHEQFQTTAKYQCLHCGIKFRFKYLLEKHVKKHDRKNKRFPCSYCGKKFVGKSEVIKHERIHTGERPYKCLLCEKTFTQSTHLKPHLAIHTGIKPFQCTTCDKNFATKSTLQQHENIHTGERPFQCPHCNKWFSRLAYLKQHQRIHTGETPYQCSHCDKKFALGSTLRLHKKTHSEEKACAEMS